MSGLTDEELVETARRGGDPARVAFGELVERHQAWLVRLLSHLLVVSPGQAEDHAQEAFVRTYQRLGQMPPGVDFRAWVRVAATRLAFNERRDSANRARILRESASPRPMTESSDAVADREALLQVLGELSYAYREVLILRHVEEMSLQEIAESLGLGLSAAKMRLKRAREAFIEAYEIRSGDRDPSSRVHLKDRP